MPFYASDFFDEEFGDTKKKKAVKKTVKVVKKQPQPTFRSNIIQQRQSANIIDSRNIYTGMRRVKLSGYLTWNTFFHWAEFTPSDIKKALVKKGFLVGEVITKYRDRTNSQYYFEIWVWVRNGYSLADVQNSAYNALQAVAYGNSIRFSDVYYLS